MELLDKFSKVITARIDVPALTTPAVPKSITLTSQLPILESFYLFVHSAIDGVTFQEVVTPLLTGWKLYGKNGIIIPSMGSLDELTAYNYAPIYDEGIIDSGVINHQLSGPPYEMVFDFYNSHATEKVTYFLKLRLAPKIELPIAPITADTKKKADDND